MKQGAILSRSDGLWCVSVASVPLVGGAHTVLPLGQCRSRSVALAVWLALQASEVRR